MPIKVLSTHAVMEVLAALRPTVEGDTGEAIAVSYDPTTLLCRRIENGESFDVAILTRQALEYLAARGVILPETCTDLCRSGLGLSVRKGALKPDVATADALRRTLLAAASVVRSKDGASGVHFEAMLTRLGIAEAMRGKVILGPSGRVAELVAAGKAEIAVQQISELLPVAGTDFAGPLPPELQHYTVFSAGVAAASGERVASRAFVSTFMTPRAAALFRTNGLEPAVRHVQ